MDQNPVKCVAQYCSSASSRRSHLQLSQTTSSNSGNRSSSTSSRTYPLNISRNVQVDATLNAVPSLSGPLKAWAAAFVHTAVLAAVDSSRSSSRATQQIAVSHAAHDTLAHIFPHQAGAIDTTLKGVLKHIGAPAADAKRGQLIGEGAAARVAKARVGDGAEKFVDYNYSPAAVGVYQPVPNDPGSHHKRQHGGAAGEYASAPASPNAGFIRPFGGIPKTEPYRVPPPDPRAPGYEKLVQLVMEKGAAEGSSRTMEETMIGYFWLEASVTMWNRIARAVMGEKLKDNVYESARFWAMVNTGIANAGFTAFEAKYRYNAWRPIHAIHWPEVYLTNNKSITNTHWKPLVATPDHPDYLSGHAVNGAGFGGVLQKYLKTDKIDPPVSITANTSHGVITRTFSSIDQAVKENGDSRVYVGVHFDFASIEGVKAGYSVAERVWRTFDSTWRNF